MESKTIIAIKNGHFANKPEQRFCTKGKKYKLQMIDGIVFFENDLCVKHEMPIDKAFLNEYFIII